MAVAALLALGMLAIMPGLIAGSALTKSAEQVPNVGTQASAAYCGYTSYTGGSSFWDCMADIWLPTEFFTLGMMAKGYAGIKIGEKVTQIGTKLGDLTIVEMGKTLIKTGSKLVRYSLIGAVVVGA